MAEAASAAKVARLAAQAGVDGFCVGSPEEGVAIRNAGIDRDILLFASTLPEDAAQVAALGLTVTIQSHESLRAFIDAGVAVDAFLEIDPGFGRFGFLPSQWQAAFEALRANDIRNGLVDEGQFRRSCGLCERC
ncbi:alanine racemase [Paraburkholderia fungorum]|uniref:alanine racemase n=1 Tax=Paraburkholderia fungorum TaxID=134537 RepID=UPI0038BA6825